MTYHERIVDPHVGLVVNGTQVQQYVAALPATWQFKLALIP